MKSIRATVKVTWYAANGERRVTQKERRFAGNTPARVIKAWKAAIEAQLRKRHPMPERTGEAGTLAKDAEHYYPLVRHLADWKTRRGEIRAWIKKLGDRHRHLIGRDDILRVRGEWLAEGWAAKTINNRLSALRNLYRVLDGDDLPTPCDGIVPLVPRKVPPQIIAPQTVNTVIRNLEIAIANGRKHAATDCARFMVYASCGKRPCEIGWAQPGDVDLVRRVWIVRDAKGGFSPGVYLNDEMVLAWQRFIDAQAWGPFNTTHFTRRLRRAGWPAGVRPYNLRHSTWIEASERGIDLADIQVGAGHRRIQTTRLHYVPVRASRMQKMSETLDDRFGWKGGRMSTNEPQIMFTCSRCGAKGNPPPCDHFQKAWTIDEIASAHKALYDAGFIETPPATVPAETGNRAVQNPTPIRQTDTAYRQSIRRA